MMSAETPALHSFWTTLMALDMDECPTGTTSTSQELTDGCGGRKKKKEEKKTGEKLSRAKSRDFHAVRSDPFVLMGRGIDVRPELPPHRHQEAP